MALTHWTFLFVATGLPQTGDVREVTTSSSTTVLAGYPTAEAAVDASLQGGLAGVLDRTELVELCGAFSHEQVAKLRRERPQIPIGLVAYAGDQTAQLHQLFS